MQHELLAANFVLGNGFPGYVGDLPTFDKSVSRDGSHCEKLNCGLCPWLF